MLKRPELLDKIISQAREHKESGQTPLKAIFDLDSTLFDVSPRITKIFHAFAELPEISKKYPEAAKKLLEMKPASSDYGVKKTLIRNGFIPPSEDFIRNLVVFWKKQFFGSDFLHIDEPYPGAKEFVLDLANAGADILYLTGRDVPRMLKGTIASLKAHGFPVEPQNLFLKPSTEIGDGEFKRHFFKELEKSSSDVWFFENEPRNIDLVLKETPHIKVVFVATVHSESEPEPGVHIPRISGFTI